ncbi:MAG: thioredoxin domain-containing protein [Frankiaceae bacterium]
MANRLATSTSPYLLQHAENPVDWWPWGPEAFEEARRRDTPILLSVGYSACHWCHVMAHESFEDPEIAGLMNTHFVSIKVDREERPDVDAVYMEAVQAMTGRGGWPMTALLTPAGEPFFCGTYFPPRAQHGMPGFPQVLQAVAQAWHDRRVELQEAGADVVRRLSQRPAPLAGEVSAELLDEAAQTLASQYDSERGGFGGAPKFPPSMCLEFLLRHAARTGSAGSLEIVTHTCERMARGGMYDQLGGGFARYSVDDGWVVPHFEKMLYDNALLLRVYLHLWRQTGSALASRVVRETAEFLLRELRTPEGGFASALDADSEGKEGTFYVWTPEQVGPYAAQLLSVTGEGTFEHGTSVLQLLTDPADEQRWQAERARLFALREHRTRPGRDDKVVAAWNGLAIAALAEAGALFDEPQWISAAEAAADLVVRVHLIDGRLRRTSRDGAVGTSAGVLEDYADVAEGLLALASVTSSGRWLQIAGGLLDTVLTTFADDSGGFYDTAADAERLVRRPQDPTDNATPAGSSAAAGALLSYAALTGSGPHRAAAEGAQSASAALLPSYARFAGWAAAVGEALIAGPAEVAVVGPAGADRDALVAAARRSPAPGAVLAVGDPADAVWVPLLADRPLVDGRPAAYVCRGFVCARPVTAPGDLLATLDGASSGLFAGSERP